jgi:hypothetical protein
VATPAAAGGVRSGAPADRPIPAPAWAGLVLLAAGVPLGGLLRRDRRRRRAERVLASVAHGR